MTRATCKNFCQPKFSSAHRNEFKKFEFEFAEWKFEFLNKMLAAVACILPFTASSYSIRSHRAHTIHKYQNVRCGFVCVFDEQMVQKSKNDGKCTNRMLGFFARAFSTQTKSRRGKGCSPLTYGRAVCASQTIEIFGITGSRR